MSYELGLKDPNTREWIKMSNLHQMKGGIYCEQKFSLAKCDIAYDYSEYFYKYICPDLGIRVLYGITGRKSIPILTDAIKQLNYDVDPDHWTVKEGNVRIMLCQCLLLAAICPNGVWDGD